VNTHHLDRIRSSASPEFLRCRWAVRASAIFYSIFSASVNVQDDGGVSLTTSRPRDELERCWSITASRAESPSGRPIPSGALSSALPPCVAAAGLAAPAARAAARVPRVAARAPPPSRNCPASALSRHRVFSSASASSSATHARAARRGVRALGDAKDADDAEEDADDAEDVEDGVSRVTARDSKSSVSVDETTETTEPKSTKSMASFFAAYSRRVSALAAQVKDLGMAGMTAYGILNTLYYTLAFTTAWSFRVIPANLSLAAAFRVAGECMALVWAGSQVTKIARLGLAVAGAPKMDQGIKSVCAKTGWAYRNVFSCVVFGCFLGSAAFFSMLVVAKAALA